MKLKNLLKKVPLKLYRGKQEVEITGLSSHSKTVAPGNLFIAKKGHVDDGSKYIDEAIAAGAVAILSDMGNPFLKEVVQLVHPAIEEVEGQLAAAFYGRPADELLTLGVTGTNGKTTITYILKNLFDALDFPLGLIGTIEYIRGEKRTPADRTTPDVITNHKFLREMVSCGCKGVAFEVTSHALEQGRVDEIDFNVALFTNLTHDHLDYHQTMENYASAKAQLFERLKPTSFAIVNGESPWTARMVQNCKAQVLRYGFSPDDAISASDLRLSASGSDFILNYQGQKIPISSPFIGRHNVLNLLAAIGALLTQKIPLDKIASLIEKAPLVRGRLERVGHSNIFVDYAHSPDALEKVLTALLELKREGRLIVVFGCGGDRDRAKRPIMAEIAERYSDLSIVTSDNPRSENPLSIIDAIVKGFKGKRYRIEPDRANAIESAIRTADEKDLILIAGKGHETLQCFAHQTIHFDDRKVAEQALKTKGK